MFLIPVKYFIIVFSYFCLLFLPSPNLHLFYLSLARAHVHEHTRTKTLPESCELNVTYAFLTQINELCITYIFTHTHIRTVFFKLCCIWTEQKSPTFAFKYTQTPRKCCSAVSLWTHKHTTTRACTCSQHHLIFK